jgi:cytochrome c oxidase cbb3-type subunit 2
MNIFNDHKRLYITAGTLFFALTYFTAIQPALTNQSKNKPLPASKQLTDKEVAGKNIYISEGCVGCHTQQVRNVDMDKMFGSRPGIAADYARMHRTSIWANTATLMGTERTGPDLTDVGNRQPSIDWHLLHLYNPRSVVSQSIMPAYEWLFEIKEQPSANDVVVNIPEQFLKGKTGKVVATEKALQLVAYLQSLKQAPLPTGQEAMQFLYAKETPKSSKAASVDEKGKTLYAQNCQSCHQENGMGLPGAFPPLKDSKIVLDDDITLYVDIIMNGYDARPEFAAMNAVGTTMKFTETDVAAIINYERTSWGNNGKKVTVEEVKKVMDFIKLQASAK